MSTPAERRPDEPPPDLYRLLDPAARADPYPLYRRLREADPVHWDPYLHAWVLTRYADVALALQDARFSACRTPTPAQLTALGLPGLAPIADVMVRQMLFLDPPEHAHWRTPAAAAFTPHRVDELRERIQAVVDHLLDAVQDAGRMDVIADLAAPLPSRITAELLGLPSADGPRLRAWSADFARMLGNYQHDPAAAPRVRRSVEEMTAYFRAALRQPGGHPQGGLLPTLAAMIDDATTEADVIANAIMLMVGGQETTTNLIGNGLWTLLHHQEELDRLRAEPAAMPAAIEELLRYESPIQQTARLLAADVALGGKQLQTRQAVIVVLGAANRDPDHFPEPDRFLPRRTPNRHLAFGWGGHFCFGAPLARLEGEIALATLLRRLPALALPPGPPRWQANVSYRGLTTLPVTF